MGSHSGVRTKIALLGSNGWSNRPIAGMSDIFVYYASLRLSLSKTNSTMHARMRNTLSFILLKGHQERVRFAAVRRSPPKSHTVEGPTL